MSRSTAWTMTAAVAVTLAAAGVGNAQPPQPGAFGVTQRPAFSPFLNLNRAGSSPTLNYYGIIRPEIQAQQGIQNLQGSVATNQQMINGLQAAPELPVTGHAASFLTYRSYFLTGGAGGQGVGSYGGGGSRSAATGSPGGSAGTPGRR